MYPLRHEIITKYIPNETDAVNQLAFIAPWNGEIVSIQSRHATASSSGTMQLYKAPSATAIGSGTAMLSAVMSLAGTASTNVTGALAATKKFLKGEAVGLVFAGTLTSLVGLHVTIVIQQNSK